MKKLFSLLALALAIIVMVTGCGSSAGNAGDSAKKGGTIGLSISTLNNPFFVSVKKGVEDEAAKLGMKVKIVDAQNDPAKQANDIADLLEGGVSILIVNPVDSAAISTSVEAANKKGIPVIALDRSADKGKVVAHIASDNVKGGEMAADLIAKKLGDKAKVAELEGIPGASATRERGEGFHKIADQKLTVVAKQSADFDRTKGLNVASNMLQANPDVQAIFAQNDEMALGAIQAAKSAGKNIFIVGFDGTADGQKAADQHIGNGAGRADPQGGCVGHAEHVFEQARTGDHARAAAPAPGADGRGARRSAGHPLVRSVPAPERACPGQRPGARAGLAGAVHRHRARCGQPALRAAGRARVAAPERPPRPAAGGDHRAGRPAGHAGDHGRCGHRQPVAARDPAPRACPA